MKTLILCLHVATAVAWPSGVYVLNTAGTDNQYYNPLTQPHSQLNLSISFRGNSYGVAQKFVTATKYTPAHRLQRANEMGSGVFAVLRQVASGLQHSAKASEPGDVYCGRVLVVILAS